MDTAKIGPIADRDVAILKSLPFGFAFKSYAVSVKFR
jgi:hypothetical protein